MVCLYARLFCHRREQNIGGNLDYFQIIALRLPQIVLQLVQKRNSLSPLVGWWWWGGGNVLAFFLLEKRVRSSQSDQSTNQYDRNNEGKL